MLYIISYCESVRLPALRKTKQGENKDVCENGGFIYRFHDRNSRGFISAVHKVTGRISYRILPSYKAKLCRTAFKHSQSSCEKRLRLLLISQRSLLRIFVRSTRFSVLKNNFLSVLYSFSATASSAMRLSGQAIQVLFFVT